MTFFCSFEGFRFPVSKIKNAEICFNHTIQMARYKHLVYPLFRYTRSLWLSTVICLKLTVVLPGRASEIINLNLRAAKVSITNLFVKLTLTISPSPEQSALMPLSTKDDI